MTTKKRILSLILVLLMAFCTVAAVSCGNTPDVTPENPKTSWPEAGVYYFDDANYENTLTLNVGDTFSLYLKGVLYSGAYTLTDSALALDFNSEDVADVTATYEGSVISLSFQNANMRFLKKLSYTVSFNVDGGSAVESQTVINGKSATKPADPTRDGYIFVGWYADADFKTPYAFGAAPVTADTTVFARWSLETQSGKEYTVNLNANYEGAEALESVATVGGKLFDLPVLTRDGYTFAGWWFSTENNGEALSYKYEDGMLLDANTTLFALWQENAAGSKLVAPIVNVAAGNLSWNSVDGARSYDVKVIGPDGDVLIDETTGSTTFNVPFSSYAAGKYEIRVTALANSGEQNNAVTVRYYVNKALTKVSEFSVIEPSTLVFNTVANAEKYLITVVCGNPEHNHTAFDNGSSRTFNFANCAMTADGIKFTVTAVADGYASSTSDVFTYTRTLGSVDGFRFDEATQTLYWNEVASAENYMVSVLCGNSAHNHGFVNFGSQTFVSLKECAPAEGGIVVKVYPKTEGYVSSEAVEFVCNKTTLDTPANILLSGSVLSWTAVNGAEKYVVSVNGTEYDVTAASFDLSTVIDVVEGVDYAISVRAVGATTSLPSDELVARYYEMNKNVTYAAGKLTWAPVIGAQYYEIQVNDGEIVKVEGGVYSAPVVLNKSGANVVKVRFVDGKTASEWATTTVQAQRVIFDTLGGNSVKEQFKAIGDPITLESAEKAGYSFVAWYNVPGGATANGAVYSDEIFSESTPLVLYAYYKANKYEITYNYGLGGSADVATDKVDFDGHYQLVVPTASDVAGAFGGWFSAPYGMGTQYTDESGNSLAPWSHLEGKELYAFWVDEALSFTLTKVNGKDVYAVSKGSRIDLVSEVTIPATYKGLPVAFISGNAFANCSNIKVLNLPETIEQISMISPFDGCASLAEINVYDVEGVSDPVFTSEDGVLLERTASGKTKLALVPMAKTGTYRIPAGVSEIPEAAFAGSALSKVIVSPDVTVIGREAFRDATNLTSVVFEVGTESLPLTIGTRAFMNCTKLAKITLPARLSDIKLQRYTLDGTSIDVETVENAFAGCIALEAINVASNNQTYKSIDNVLFTKDGKTLLLAPASLSGTYVIPEGTTSVSAGAFVGCSHLEEIRIPSTLAVVDECAFYGLESLKKVTFSGTSFRDLSVGKYAFRNCESLEDVVLEDGSRLATLGEGAFMGCTSLEAFTVPATMTNIGASAFADCSELATISFANGGKTLEFGANAFQNCVALSVVNLPANVSKIPGVFAGCTSLTEVNVDPASTFFKSEDGVVYDFAKTEIVFFPQGKSGEYEIPATVTTINNGVFQNVTKLTKLTINNTITYIGDNAFNGASIPVIEFVGEAKGTLVIGDNAFKNATLGTLTLPAHTVSIGNSAFYMTSAEEVVLNEGITSLGDYAFWGAELEITVPASVKTIGDYCFAARVEAGWWTYYYGPSVTLTVENSKLETIGNHAFRENENVEDIVIPASVKTIGNYAFYACTELGDVTFASGSVLESIGAFAFAHESTYDSSYYFETITIPGTVKTIGAYAFANTRLTTVIFEEGTEDLYLGATYVDRGYNESMGAYYTDIYRGHVFYYCSYLETVELPARLTVLEQATFKYAGDDELNVTIKGENPRLTTIGDECFYYSSLVSFVIPKSVTNLPAYTDPVSGETYDRLGIGESAFYGLYSTLTSITFEMGGDLPLTIGAGAFDGASKLTSMALPARLATYTSYTGETIAPLADGASVFEGCDLLASISVEDKAGAYYTSFEGVLMTADMKEIVYYPMARAGEFTVPATVTKIHDRAFYEAEGLTSLKFAGGTEDMVIGNAAFAYCTLLTSIVLPDNVTTLGTSTFSGCSSLESITLSKSLTVFDSQMVTGCKKLAALNVGANGQGDNFSSVNGILYNADKSALVAYPLAKTDAEVVVDSNVKIICVNAFASNSSIQKVVLPAGLVEIQKNAFNQCSGLKEINIPATVQKIDDNAFYYCTALNTVNFDDGGDDLLIIGNYAFYDTYALETLALPARVYSIGNNAFYESALSNLTFAENSALVSIGDSAFASTGVIQLAIPAGVVNIGNYAFYQCADLLEITFSEGLVSIGDHAFAGSTSLVSVSFPASLKTLGASVFYYYEYDEYTCSSLESVTFAPNSQLEKIPAGTFAYTALKSFTVPASVTVIEGVESASYKNPSAFYEITTLESVDFENGSKCSEIGAYTFAECTGLKDIEIPTSVSTIGAYAFNYAASLESVVIPETTTNLGNGAFWGCSSLTDVELRTKTTEIPANLFYGCSSLADITIPASVSVIASNAFSGTALESVKVDPRNTYFKSIDGILYTADGTGIVLIPAQKNLGDFVIPNTVTAIGDELFEGLGTLKTLTFEGGRTEPLTIGERAFAECYNLTSVKFTEKIASIGERAFYSCGSLVSVYIASDMTESVFGEDAFYYCESLIEVCNKSQIDLAAGSKNCGYVARYALRVYTEGESAVSVNNGFVLMNMEDGVYLISYVGDETSVTVPEGVTHIYTYAFGEGIEHVTLASTVKEIMEGAFYDSSIKSVTFNEGLLKIGYSAFYYADLESLDLPDTIVEIGEDAFYGTKISGTVALPESLTSVGSYALSVSSDITFVTTLGAKPSGWSSSWCNSSYATVLWGFTGEDITYNFETNGGSAVDSITSGMPITVPAAPARDGYIFVGWYDNAELSGSAVSGSYYNGEKTTLYAKWMSQEEFEALYAGTSMEYAYNLNLGDDVVVDITTGGQYVYYKFTTDESGYYNFYLYGGDTMIYLYSASGSREKTFYAEYVNGGYTTIDSDYSLSANTTYYIAVRYYYSSDTGPLDLSVSKA